MLGLLFQRFEYSTFAERRQLNSMGAASTILAVASSLVTIAASAPMLAAFQASDVLVTYFESYSPSNVTVTSPNAYIKFNVYDSDPVTNSTTDCGAQWSPLNGTAPTLYVRSSLSAGSRIVPYANNTYSTLAKTQISDGKSPRSVTLHNSPSKFHMHSRILQ